MRRTKKDQPPGVYQFKAGDRITTKIFGNEEGPRILVECIAVDTWTYIYPDGDEQRCSGVALHFKNDTVGIVHVDMGEPDYNPHDVYKPLTYEKK